MEKKPLAEAISAFLGITRRFKNEGTIPTVSMCSYEFLEGIHRHLHQMPPHAKDFTPDSMSSIPLHYPYDEIERDIVESIYEEKEYIEPKPDEGEMSFYAVYANHNKQQGIVPINKRFMYGARDFIKKNKQSMRPETVDLNLSIKISELLTTRQDTKQVAEIHNPKTRTIHPLFLLYKTEYEGQSYPLLGYGSMQKSKCRDATSHTLWRFRDNLKKATTKDEQLLALASCVRSLMLIHPFNDGNGRTIRVWYQSVLLSLEQTPVILDHWSLMFVTPEKLLRRFKEGQQRYLTFLEHLKAGSVDKLGFTALTEQKQQEIDLELSTYSDNSFSQSVGEDDDLPLD